MEYPNNIEKVYGPYTRKSDKREVVRIKLTDGSFKMKSYARYLKEIELGRELDKDTETVDHKNRNHLDNNENNLQILSRSENSKKSALRRATVVDNCVWCGVEFTLSDNQVKSVHRKKSGPFCSRKCSGKYGAELQNNRTKKLDSNNIEVTYYRNDDIE